MFQIPALIVLTIAATRMHRSLINFTHSGYYISYVSCRVCPHAKHGRCCSFVDTYPAQRGHVENIDPKLNFAAPISLDQVEVSVHTSTEDYLPMNMRQYASFGQDSADSQSQDKSLVLSVRNHLEN